jgi:pimeloyl-ACP methyl ester carboxylesterase
LRAAGHDVYTPTLTGLGERAHLAHPRIDLDTHILVVVGVLEYEDLRGIVLVGHSYGAVVVTGVADRVRDRIAHLVYLDGTEATNGQAVIDFFPAEWRAMRRAQVDAEGEGWKMSPPADLSGLGISRADDAAWVRSKLVPQPFETFAQPLRLENAAGFGGPKIFIACTEAPQADWRDAMSALACAGHGWRYRELATGHDSMITAPRELTALLLQIAQSA